MAELRVSLCESVWASSLTPFHVRLLDVGEEQVFTGGLTLMSLCGREVAWDVPVPGDVEQILQPESIVCPSCKAALAVHLRDMESRRRGLSV